MGQVETREEGALSSSDNRDNRGGSVRDRDRGGSAPRDRDRARSRTRSDSDDDDEYDGARSGRGSRRQGSASRPNRSGMRSPSSPRSMSDEEEEESSRSRGQSRSGTLQQSMPVQATSSSSMWGLLSGSSRKPNPQARAEREKEKEEECQQFERVYLDLSCRGLKALSSPAPRDLAPFTEAPSTTKGSAFRYLEALSLHNNFLTSLNGLERVLHLPLLIELDVSDNTIDAIDDELWEFMGSVERLNLSCNKVEYISASIASLGSLAELNMASNSLVYLPNEIGRLTSLNYLNVSSNQLHALPESVNGLHNLRKLLVSNNYLEVFVHPRAGDLRNLVWLDLSWNKIKTFPTGLGNLGATLEKLYLGHNDLKSLDGHEIRKLKVLRELSVPHNKLKTLPQQLGMLTHLIILDIEENSFTEKEYKTTNVQDLLAWLKDPRANPIKVVQSGSQPAELATSRKSKDVETEFQMDEYKNQLYRLKGENRIVMQKMQVKRGSLNEGDSFILDVGHTLYVWHGPESNPRERAKTNHTARALSEEELGGVPVVHVIDDHEDKFWNALGGFGYIASAEDGGDDAEWEQHFADGLILYKFSKEDQVDVIEGFESPFFHAMLNSTHSYVLESGENLFTWCGKDCTLHNRSRAMVKAEELASEKRDRDEFVEISFVIDGAETIYFREQFVDWSDEADWLDELASEKKSKPATIRTTRAHIERPKSSYVPTKDLSAVHKILPKEDVAVTEKDRPKSSFVSPKEQSAVAQLLAAEGSAAVPEGKRKLTRKQIKELKDAELKVKQNEEDDVQKRKLEAQQMQAAEELRLQKGKEEAEKKRKEDELRAAKKKEDEAKAKLKKEEDARKKKEEDIAKEKARVEAERKRREDDAKEVERKRLEDVKERQRKEAEAKERERILREETAKERKKREAEEEAARKRKEEEDREKRRLDEIAEKERKRKDEEHARELKRKADEAEKERKRKEEEAEKERKRKDEVEAERERQRETEKKAEQARQNATRIAGSSIQLRPAVTTASTTKPAASKFGAAVDVCEVCAKRVYLTERISVEGKVFHNTCFKCAQCKSTLKPGNYASNDGIFYCKPHFKQLFAERGDYAGGFGGKKPGELWAEKKQDDFSLPTATEKKPEPVETKPAVTVVASSPRTPRKEPLVAKEETLASPRQETKEDVVVALAREFPEIGIERVESAMQLFNKWDPRGTGQLAKPQYLRLMQQAIGANKFAERPIFQKLVELSFENADKKKQGVIGRKEFLVCYYDLFSNERRQVALLLSKEFPGLSVDKIEVGLQQFEQYTSSKEGSAVIDMDEFYQLKDELAPNLKKLISKIFKTGSGELDATQFLKAYEEFFGQKKQAANESVIASRPVPAATMREEPQAPKQERKVVARGGRNPDTIFTEFRNADNLQDIVESFVELKEACGGDSSMYGLPVYNLIKGRVGNNNADTVWQLLNLRLTQVEYSTGFKARPPRTLIVGSGPGGLRSAIEFALLGCDVVVLEKRQEYSRNNLLHIWPSTIRDLKNIGGKFFHAQLCVGGIEHIAIRSMQCMLLKIALLLGVKFLAGVGYTHAQELSASQQPDDPFDRKFCWKVEVSSPSQDKLMVPFTEKDMYVNVIVGADGENSAVAKDLAFDRKIMQGGRAIGITANFVNGNSREEKTIREFGLLAVYNQEFFSKLKEQHNIDLENLVYYREQTHYFVMTAKMRCLVEKGVCKKSNTDTAQLLARDNMDMAQLEVFVRQVADYTGIPPTCPFARNHAGNKDVAIFDFSKKQMAIKHMKLFGEEEGARGLAALVGDALIEPFWPLGTGANRAVLSALDTAWMVKGLFGNQGRQVASGEIEKMARQWAADFKVMMNAGPEDLVSNFGLHTIAPTSRYKKNTLGHFH